MTVDMKAMRYQLRDYDEGDRSFPYKDSFGYWTVGTGFLIDSRRGGAVPAAVLDLWAKQPGGVSFPLPQAVDDFWLDLLIGQIEVKLNGALPWFEHLDDVRQRALCDMAFQMGVGGLLGFGTMLKLVATGQYASAADDAEGSAWARQTPARAARVIRMIRTGLNPWDQQP